MFLLLLVFFNDCSFKTILRCQSTIYNHIQTDNRFKSMNVEERKQDQFRKLIFTSQKIGGIRKFFVKDLA